MVISHKLAQKIKRSPQTPGIYIYKNAIGEVLYVGKAINLKKRLLYYTKDEKDMIPKTALFLEQAASLNWIEVKSELEALLLEMNLIRTLKPKYNSVNKDDKRPLFVHITNDEYPRVKTARIEISGTGDYIGPFPSSKKLKSILRSLRRIFPFCTCGTKRKKPCMYADLGLCNPSPFSIKNKIEAKQYRSNITKIKYFLRGNVNKVLKLLEVEMNQNVKQLKFEKAQNLKEQINAINELLISQHHIGEYLNNEAISNNLQSSQHNSLAQFLGLNQMERIEGYDIANTSGTNSTASMVVFINGHSDTSQYRKFKVIRVSGPNDAQMIYDTLKRRFNHPEWNFPQLILVDGGKAQVSAAVKAIKQSNLNIPVIGLAKRFEQIIVPQYPGYKVITPPLDSPYLTLLRAVRDEAHRFTTTYHKKLRLKSMLKNK